MNRLLYIFILLSFFSCGSDKDSDERVLKLGKDLVEYAVNSESCCSHIPKDVASIGNSTYWLLKTIKIEGKDLEFKLTEEDFYGESGVDYNLTIKGSHSVTLRLIYDSEKDQYHIKGYFSDIPGKFNKNWNKFIKRKGDLGAIIPGKGVCGFQVGKSRCSEIFTDSLNEDFYKEMGITFHFNKGDTLKDIVITDNLQLVTESGIRLHDSDSKVKEYFGEPVSEGISLNKGDYLIGQISSLNYDGISFVLSGGEVKMIVVSE